MRNYESMHGRLPPAAVRGNHGEPLLSWRVLLLPFIEQADLHRRFRLDEPWDSPHNIELLSEMPRLYELPPSKRSMIPANHTVCHIFIGKGAAFEGTEGLNWSDFRDGVSDTILIIEAGKPVPWTKPEDLAYDPAEPFPALDGFFRDIIRAGMANGRVRYIRKDASETTMRALITRNGGEAIEPEWEDQPK